MINIFNHLENEEEVYIDVREINGSKSVTLGDANTFMTEEQAEELFDKLDAQLHNKTWVQMEESALGLEADVEEMQSTIDYYRQAREDHRAV